MTPEPPTPDPDPDLEAATAVLEGTATPEQRRHVARRAEARALLDALRDAAQRVAAPPAPPPAPVLAELRARALAAGDGERGDDAGHRDPRDGAAPPADAETVGGNVVALTRPRAPGPRRPALPAVAAVVLLLLVVGGGLVVSGLRSDPDQQAERMTSVGGALDDGDTRADDAPSEAPSAAGHGPRPEAALALPDGAQAGDGTGTPSLGTFADDDALRAHLEATPPDLWADGEGGTPPAGAELDRTDAGRCSAVILASDPDVLPATAFAQATVGDAVLLVLANPVAGEAGRTLRVSVVDPTSCVPRFGVQHDR